MAYSLYSKDRWLGHFANISGYGLIVSAVNRYNGAADNRGKIPTLTDFIEKGETKEVQALIPRCFKTADLEKRPFEDYSYAA